MKFLKSDGFVLFSGAIIGIVLISIYAGGFLKLVEYIFGG